MNIRVGRPAALAAGTLALLGFSLDAPARLDFDRGILADDLCLAPAYDQPGCTAGRPSGPIDSRASASAALLPWDMPLPEPEPFLAFDKAVLEASVEVTFVCAPGECRPRRQVLAKAGSD
jgi:hypothetical protein